LITHSGDLNMPWLAALSVETAIDTIFQPIHIGSKQIWMSIAAASVLYLRTHIYGNLRRVVF
jgi:hypothetical protein